LILQDDEVLITDRERLSHFLNLVAFITDTNALQHSNFCLDRLLANDRYSVSFGHSRKSLNALRSEAMVRRYIRDGNLFNQNVSVLVGL
jgi:hypothetical protein